MAKVGVDADPGLGEEAKDAPVLEMPEAEDGVAAAVLQESPEDDLDVNEFRRERRSRLQKKAVARSGQSIVWNLILYSCFVAIFTYVNIRAMTSSGESLFSFYLTDAVRDQTLTGALGDEFSSINDVNDIYRWLNGRLLPGLLDESFDRGKAASGVDNSLEPFEDPYDAVAECDFKGEACAATNYTTALVMRFNHLIGGVRLRSQRVKNCSYEDGGDNHDDCPALLRDTWCKVHHHFKEAIQERTDLRCFPEVETAGVTLEISELLTTRAFGPGDRFTHSSAAETGEGSHLSAGLWNWYPGSGYLVDLPLDLEEASGLVAGLEADDFLDAQTRVLFVDFAVFNPIHNLFTVVRATFEIPSIGRFIPSYSIRTIKIYSVTDRDKRIEVLEYMLLVFVNLYALREIVEVIVLGPKRYLKWFDAQCPHCLTVLSHSHEDLGHRCCLSCGDIVSKESDIKRCEVWMEELMLDAFMCRGCLDQYNKLTPRWWLDSQHDQEYAKVRSKIISNNGAARGSGRGQGGGRDGGGGVLHDLMRLLKRVFLFEIFLTVRLNAMAHSLTAVDVPNSMRRRREGGEEREHVHELYKCNHCSTQIPNAMRAHMAVCKAASEEDKAKAAADGPANTLRGWSSTSFNVMDLITLALLLFSMYQRLITRKQFEDELEALYEAGRFPHEYHSFQDVADYMLYNNSVNAVNALLIYLKFFKYLGAVPGIMLLARTIGKSLLNVTYFCVILGVLLLGFGTAFHIVFGTEMEEFNTLPQSVVTLTLFLLGDYDYRSLVAVTRLAPVLFMAWMLLGFFVLLNVFIALIMAAYDEAREEERRDTHAVATFFEDALQKTRASRVWLSLHTSLVKRLPGWAKQRLGARAAARPSAFAGVKFPRKAAAAAEEKTRPVEEVELERLLQTLDALVGQVDLEADVRESRMHLRDSANMIAASNLLKTARGLLAEPAGRK